MISRLLNLNKGDLHVEVRRGTRNEAREYCRKVEGRLAEPWEFGEWNERQQGKRNDILEGLAILKDKGLKGVCEEKPELFLRHHRSYAAYLAIMEQPKARTKERITYVLVGESGIGKTKWAFDNFGAGGLFISALSEGKALWFDGYTGQQAAIIDDFRGSISFENVLKLTDPWYDHRCPVKNSFVIWKPDVVIITSNEHYTMWWPSLSSDQLAPLRRRIQFVNVVTRADFPTIAPPPTPPPRVEIDDSNWFTIED